jgi:hypothetical protein
MKGRNGLPAQIELLRDSAPTKDHLVRYLAYRSAGAAWERTFKASASRYLNDRSDVSLFGVLIRDVSPQQTDLGQRPHALAKNCPQSTSIELRVKYFPAKSISGFVAALAKPTKAAP